MNHTDGDTQKTVLSVSADDAMSMGDQFNISLSYDLYLDMEIIVCLDFVVGQCKNGVTGTHTGMLIYGTMKLGE